MNILFLNVPVEKTVGVFFSLRPGHFDISVAKSLNAGPEIRNSNLAAAGCALESFKMAYWKRSKYDRESSQPTGQLL